MHRSTPLGALCSAVAILCAGEAAALTIPATGIAVSVPAGGAAPSGGVYTDDVILESLSFADATFATGDSFRSIVAFEVLEGRGNINAEWGDDDDDGDGNDTPFAKAGFAGADQETVDPAIQDATLLNAFNSRSLSEMSDGEGGTTQFKVLFSNGLYDNDVGADLVPELVFFERGMNDVFDVELIIGGAFDDPIYSEAVRVDSADFWDTGISVDTVEINGAQEIGAGGLDLTDFGLGAGEAAYGFRLTYVSGGPDLNGFFLSAENPADFIDPLPVSEVPLPAAAPLFLTALAGLAALRRRSRAA